MHFVLYATFSFSGKGSNNYHFTNGMRNKLYFRATAQSLMFNLVNKQAKRDNNKQIIIHVIRKRGEGVGRHENCRRK